MIRAVSFVSIPVKDQNRALEFYTTKLGFLIHTDQPYDDKQRWIELRIPKAETRVVLFTADGDAERIGTFMNMTFDTADLDATYQEMTANGVEFEGELTKEEWGSYGIFKDSEGNKFCLSQK